MKGKGITVRLRIDGARQTLDAFRHLPKEANSALRNSSQRIAELLAGRVQSAARAEGRQAALLASTVKARRDRMPAIQAGGTRRIGSRRKPAFKLLFGSEFGSDRLGQFKPHRGQGSYWFFSTVESEQQVMSREWNSAAEQILRAFTRGGDR